VADALGRMRVGRPSLAGGGGEPRRQEQTAGTDSRRQETGAAETRAGGLEGWKAVRPLARLYCT
jgi:hypothetical protein